MFENFSQPLVKVIMLAQEEARRIGRPVLGTEQLLVGLILQGNSLPARVFSEMKISLEAVRQEIHKIVGTRTALPMNTELPFSPRAKRALEYAVNEAQGSGSQVVQPEHLLLALLRGRMNPDGGGVAVAVLVALRVDLDVLRARLVELMGATPQNTANAGGGLAVKGNNEKRPSATPTIDEHCTDLTQKAAKDELDPMVGREKEVSRVIQILGRRSKNNPVLIGEPGVGKTAIAEGLAQRMVDGDVPPNLAGKRVLVLDIAMLIAGTKFRGEFEDRFSKIIAEAKKAANIIFVIDEVHTLVGGGAAEGGLDASNLLKPALSRGELQCIGATTLREYKLHIERDKALERRFQPVMILEPTLEDAIAMVMGSKWKYEEFHMVEISPMAVIAAVTLSRKYIADRYLPDKAFDLIDEAASRLRILHSKFPVEVRELDLQLKEILAAKREALRSEDYALLTGLVNQENALRERIYSLASPRKDFLRKAGTIRSVTEEDIAYIVAEWSGIPVQKLSAEEAQQALKMEEYFATHLIGQKNAVAVVSKAIRRKQAGLNSGNRPIASFIFCGPTGVGKTELVKAMARYLFGSEAAMIRIDCSELMERHTISKLIGSPPGYVGFGEGGQLTEAVRRRPYAVVLFDEIEKAHPDVSKLMLQILEDGRLTDAEGRVVSFKNTIIIMTSNLGSATISKGGQGLGFALEANSAAAEYTYMKSQVQAALSQFFPPEFLNRLDEVVMFSALTRDDIIEIAKIQVRELATRLAGMKFGLDVAPKVFELLVKVGYDPAYGARPLRRAVTDLLEDPITEAILAGTITQGDTALCTVGWGDKVTVKRK